jgi:deoxyribonuclease V
LIACLDVHYPSLGGARAAVVAFESWSSPTASVAHVVEIAEVAPYEPGAFYKRELPCLLAALERLEEKPDVVIVDAHVWLGPDRPGLGARLLEASKVRTVVGVAKTRFTGAPAVALLRGASATPLYVDECGERVGAPDRIREMHGNYRVPTLLRFVDQLCRDPGAVSGKTFDPEEPPSSLMPRPLGPNRS